jgi:hypothetical protein
MKQIKVWELNSQIESLLEQYESVNEETGELNYPEDILARIESLELTKEESLLAIANKIKNNKHLIKGIKERIETQKSKIESLENYNAWLEGILENNVPRHLSSKTAITDGETKLYWMMSESVDAPDVDQLPSEYVRVKTTREADKVSIKKMIKEGVEIPGASLVQNLNLQIK